MEEANMKNPALEMFPHVDILPQTAIGLVIPLQNEALYDQLHDISHRSNTILAITHSMLACMATEAIDDETKEKGLITGCEIYEIISSIVRPYNYMNEQERQIAVGTTLVLAEDEPTTALIDVADIERQRLKQDNPLLHAMVKEIAEARLARRGVVVDYAIAGVGIMRSI